MAHAATVYLNNCLAGGLTPTTNYFISLHSADPGNNGANEFSGGGYSRQTWTASTPSGGSQSNTNAISIPNAGSTAATYFGIWTLASGGVFQVAALIGGGTSVTAAAITFAAGTAAISATAP